MVHMSLSRIVLSSVVLSGLLCSCLVPVNAATFVNPIVKNGQDPWVIYHEGYYYYCGSWGNASSTWIFVGKARRLQGIGSVTPVRVWTPPSGTAYSKEIWAPELHYLDGKWYVYFAADDGNNDNHRMYVLEGNTQDPQGSYTFKGQLKPATDYWAIDGTVLELGGSQKFFVWSGRRTAYASSGPYVQNLYVAQMSNPWTIKGDRYLLSEPTYDWEGVVEPSGARSNLNEGPTVLKRKDKIHIIYSASQTASVSYCLGQLTYSSGDMLDMKSWVKKSTPAFSATTEVLGPGHASFTKSPDGTEDWIVYHCKKNTGWNWERQVSTQKFTWNANDEPVFGSPIAPGIPIQEPSDTAQAVTTASASTRSGTSSIASTTVLGTSATQVPTSSSSEGMFMIVAVVLVVSFAVSLTVYRRRHKPNEKR